MFYPEKIRSIKATDKVLEIGPGATPHPRSDVFLELKFDSVEEKLAQRGGGLVEGRFGSRPIYYYDGGRFPFSTGEFDYVICSHVIEHVERPDLYLAEVFRVSKGRGYLEYPLITYEYLYNFNVHLQFVKFDALLGVLLYLPKDKTGFENFAPVSAVFQHSLVLGWDDLCAANPTWFIEGFEYHKEFAVELASCAAEVTPSLVTVPAKRPLRRLINKAMNTLGL